MASHSDEEALDSLIDARQPENRPLAGKSGKIVLGSGLCLAVFALAYWGRSAKTETEFARQANIQSPLSFQQKSSVGDSAVEPPEALQRNEKRQRLIVEQDLKTILHMHVGRRQSHFQEPSKKKDGAEVCHEQAGHLFDAVIEDSSMDKELETQEHSAFKHRFTSAMKQKCKDIISERMWLEEAGKEFESQKPVMTAALANTLNSAGLGFEAKMHEWLVQESVESFQKHLGLLPTPEGQKSILNRKNSGRHAEHLPAAFRAELKWPQCRDAILKIHNQGHCGSCWAFGGLASMDARMCIASNGQWDASEDVLSRLQVTSCAPDNYWEGHDGCQGGFPHWPMEFMAKTGVVSTSCLPYYISGEGVEHFQHQDTAPPCESHCQGGYSMPIGDDAYTSAGAGSYDWITDVHGDATKIGIMKTAMYEEGPVAFAFKANHEFMGYTSGVFSVCNGHERANHAVYAFGWGISASVDGASSVEYIEASNSWGSNWGNDGHFRIAPLCVTDVTIPGTIEGDVVGHSVGIVDSTVPRDPDNEYWPWPQPDQCAFSDGCVTDMEGAGNYSNNEECVSQALHGKTITVTEFDLEYGYDILHVNGIAFSGTKAQVEDRLNGIVVGDQGIKFTSDFSLAKAGFKICEQ